MPPVPQLTIVHGDRDTIVPQWMGAALYAHIQQSYPAWTAYTGPSSGSSGGATSVLRKARYLPVVGADHNAILRTAFGTLYTALTAPVAIAGAGPTGAAAGTAAVNDGAAASAAAAKL
jgi:hypothetical protein